MLSIDLIDHKGDHWCIVWAGYISRYLSNGEAYWKTWWHVKEGPYELRNYTEIPTPVFTDWWPQH